jgi:hypothetical protein
MAYLTTKRPGAEEVTMADVLYVAMFIALTAIGILFVLGCDKIIGPDDVELAKEPGTRTEPERQLEELAA